MGDVILTPAVWIAYGMYCNAMNGHLRNVENFEELLRKETVERAKYEIQNFTTNDKIVFPFAALSKTILDQLFPQQRAKFITKFFEKRPNILNEKIQQVLANYKHKIEAISNEVSLQEFHNEYRNASKIAIEELERQTCLGRDSTLWMQAVRKLRTEMKTFERTYYSNNLVVVQNYQKTVQIVHENKRADKDPGTSQTYIDARKVQVDMTNTGLLGRGGFGQVRVGFFECSGPVAVKVPRFSGNSAVEAKHNETSFIQEIQLMHQVNHENIVRIKGYTAWNHSVAMIMEYMPGGNLSTLLLCKLGGQFLVQNIPEALQRRFCFDISSGVAYLHDAFYDERIVHGDLKPSNILLTGDLKCKIGDFGGADIATCSECLSSTPKNEKQGQQTRGYVAPERLNNRRLRVSKPMDVYSVGIIFYVVLSRQRPFNEINETKNEITQFCQQSTQKTLKQLIVECTDLDHKKRPKMLTVRDQLQSLLLNEDPADIAQNVVEVLKSYKCKSFIANTSSWPILADVDNF